MVADGTFIINYLQIITELLHLWLHSNHVSIKSIAVITPYLTCVGKCRTKTVYALLKGSEK